MNGSLDHLLIYCAANFCIAGAALGCGYAVIVMIAVTRVAGASEPPRTTASPVTLLKPLHGNEPDLQVRLASFCQQNYDGPTQIVFGCQDRSDPAVEVVKRLQTSLPHRAVDLVVDGRSYGENRKISNLINIVAAARYEVLVASDSDIEVGPDYLSKVTAALDQPGVGAVTCLYHGLPTSSIASSFSALSINAHFLPNVMIAVFFGLAQPCFGSTIAFRRATLKRIGGFHAFADRLADDYLIGQAIRQAGFRVAISTFSIGHVCAERTFREFVQHQLRCARTIRSIDYFGYAGAIIANPLPLAILGVMDGREGALLLVGAAIATRLALCKTVERALSLPRQQYWLLPAADLVLFVIFICSFFGSSVSWRGRRYRILSKGALSHDSN